MPRPAHHARMSAGLATIAALGAALGLALAACAPPAATAGRTGPRTGGTAYDVVITGGRIVDGTGSAWFHGDVGIRGGRIASVAPAGALADADAARRVDARGLVVAPGFIDIQGHSRHSLLHGDGRVVSKVTQGITTEILGEGWTNAPTNARTRALNAAADYAEARLDSIYGERFSGRGGFGRWLEAMEQHGMSVNAGSFVGSATVRAYAMGARQGAPSAAELDTMRAVLRDAMTDGAFGLATALIYPPDNFSTTEQLVELARAMAPYGGVYITHMRSEADQFLEALDEAIRIGAEGGVPVEVYHLKAAGRRNWDKIPRAIAKIDSARAAGIDVQANMYPYEAGGTALAACTPPWASADDKLLDNLRDSAVRAQVMAEMLEQAEPRAPWENLCQLATPEGVVVAGFETPALERFEGQTLAAIASARGQDWADALIDLTLAENAGLGAMFFIASEQNLALQMRQPWIKFGTDAGGIDPDSAKSLAHPRAYGTFPRILGRYVREQGVMPLEEAVRKMTSAVATRLSIPDRGIVREGFFADLVVFDPATIIDRATYERPHQISAGVRHVFVNGVAVVKDGKHTGAKPGRIVRGPGFGRTVASAPDDASLAARIRRVETGLLPAVTLRGQPIRGMTLAERMRHHHTPGLSVAVIDDGRIEWARGYGVSDAEGGRPVDTTTLFQAASISKPVAAVVALRLAEQGRLALDEDVNASLRGWRVPDSPFLRDEQVTPRRLLTHSAGLTVHGFGGYAAGQPVPTTRQVLDGTPPANSAPVRADTVPGSVWRYSGGGYTVLQQLIEDVTARPFTAVARELVLGPAGMRWSTYEQPLPPARESDAAAGHATSGAPIPGRHHTYPEMAAAGLWTTPSDLARLAIELQRSLAGKRDGVLSPEMTKRMLSRQFGSWGLGFEVDGAGDSARFSHGGSNEGFRAFFVAFHARGQGAVVMTNGDGGGEVAMELVRSIAREYDWPAFRPDERVLVAADPADLARLSGRYVLAVETDTLSMNVQATADTLRLTAPFTSGPRVLHPIGDARFVMVENALEVQFERDAAGAVTGLVLEAPGQTFRARRMP